VPNFLYDNIYFKNVRVVPSCPLQSQLFGHKKSSPIAQTAIFIPYLFPSGFL
jgi:hypothetical protein